MPARTPTSKRGSSLRAIAEATGLSVPTVSGVLGNRSHLFRAQTRRKVLQAASRLGYRPNASAQAMRSGRFNTLSLLLSNILTRSTLPIPLLDGILAEAQRHGNHVILSQLPDEKLTDEGFVPLILTQSASDGLLINYTDHIPQQMIDLIRLNKLPAVWLNTKQPRDCVRPDDHNAGARAAAMLADAGHRRIAYMDATWGPDDMEHAHYSVNDREAGYREEMLRRGLKPVVVRPAQHLGRTERVDWAIQHLRQPDRMTAAVCYGTGVAIPVALAARELGLVIPVDLSLVTFGESVAFEGRHEITTLIVPQHEMGVHGVRLLLDRIAGRATRSVVLPFEGVHGNTVVPPERRPA